VYYLQHGEEEAATTKPKRPRAAAELEVRPGRNIEDQIAVVVSTLLDDQKSDHLDTMKTVIQKAITEIKAWHQEAEARRLLNDENGIEQTTTRKPTIRTILLIGPNGSDLVP